MSALNQPTPHPVSYTHRRTVVELADRPRLINDLRGVVPDASQDELDQLATGQVFTGLLLAVALFALYTSLANRMARGVNWARVLLTVLAGFGALVGLGGLIAIASGIPAAFGLTLSPVNTALSLVDLAVDVTAMVLMFVPAAAAYFTARRRPRRPSPPPPLRPHLP